MKQHRQLDQREANIWAVFVASLFVRSRKFREQISKPMIQKFQGKARDLDFIRGLQLNLLRQGGLHYAQDIQDTADKILNRMDTNPSLLHVFGLRYHTSKIAKGAFNSHLACD